MFSLFSFSFQVALNVDEHAYALIFGWNTFVALALQSIMTIVVADKRGLDLDIRIQVRCSGVPNNWGWEYFRGVKMFLESR